jgi:site-specific recombinase
MTDGVTGHIRSEVLVWGDFVSLCLFFTCLGFICVVVVFLLQDFNAMKSLTLTLKKRLEIKALFHSFYSSRFVSIASQANER